jgi:Ca2+-binding RTX toxin-like protein
VIADLRTQTITNDGFGNAETMTSIENLGSGTRFADLFHGDDGANYFGVGTNDTGYGYGGDDLFQVEGAPAIVDGGAGTDTASFVPFRVLDLNGDGVGEQQDTTRGVEVSLAAGRILNDGFGGSGDIINVENLTGNLYADVLTGNDVDNVLTGLFDGDVLSGGGGADTLDGGEGSDTLQGGAGLDVALFAEARSAYSASRLADGSIQITLGNDVDVVSGVEVFRFADGSFSALELLTTRRDGTAGDDFMVGGAGGDALYGGNGNDILRGNGGDDLLSGGAGDDHMRGGPGADTFEGGAGFDQISFFEAAAVNGIHVDLRIGKILNDGFGNEETVSSIEALGAGTRFADIFHGDDNRNLFLPGHNDAVYGHGGDDEIAAGGMPATVDGGDGIDFLSLFLGTTTLAAETSTGAVVDLAAGTVSADGFGGSGTVVNVENLGGTFGSDRLAGDAGANRIEGYEGADTLTGGGGADTLDGGAGVDMASYANAAARSRRAC